MCRRVSQDIFPNNLVSFNCLWHVQFFPHYKFSLHKLLQFLLLFSHLILHQIFSKFQDSLTIKVQMLHFSTEMGVVSPTLKVGEFKPPYRPPPSTPLSSLHLEYDSISETLCPTQKSQTLMIHLTILCRRHCLSHKSLGNNVAYHLLRKDFQNNLEGNLRKAYASCLS